MRLARRQLFMLPTRHGLVFGVVVLVLLLAGVNYGNGLVYALTFLLVAVALVSMLDTHRNLLGVEITPGPCPPVFAGEDARFSLCLHNPADYRRLGVALEVKNNVLATVDLAPRETRCVELRVPALRRGWLEPPPVVLSTRYPLGLFRCWSRRQRPAQRCLVYPQPGPARPWPESAAAEGGGLGAEAGDTDFAGLHEFRPGDSPRHIHWKALARGQGLLTKRFAGAAAGRVWLDWTALPGMETEARLSQLCRWVLDAEGRADYGLRLPGTSLGPAQGASHRRQCLQALALF